MTPDETRHGFEMAVLNRPSEVDRVNETFERFAEKHGIPVDVARKLGVAFDDLLHNIVSYAYDDEEEHEIHVSVELADRGLVATIADDGVPFDPLGRPSPDTAAPLTEREIGGLGIHIVRNVMDELSYCRRDGRNVLTLVKRFD